MPLQPPRWLLRKRFPWSRNTELLALFWVGNDVQQVARVSFDFEIEAPGRVNATLRDIAGLVVFLGSQRWVAEIQRKQRQLFIALLLNAERSARKTPAEALRVEELYLGLFRFFHPVKRA